MSELAIFGGSPIRTLPFPAYNPIGEEEKAALLQVAESGVLSKFLGSWNPDFYGGSKVQEFEQAWAKHFGVKYAISVNSNTSGLYAAIGAVGVEPGDEVIVSPYTMTASAACVLGWGAVPVFADIDPRTFCLDYRSVAERITSRTKAVVAVDLFGHPFDADPLLELANRHGLTIIEDCAQAPMASYKGRWTGTLGQIGVFSLNYHKHIHTGEGGVIVTNSESLAERLQLIRNHGETVMEAKGSPELRNIIGQNYRLTELQAAIGVEQLKKLPGLIKGWQSNARQISRQLGEIPGVVQPIEEDGCQHVYYLHAMKWDNEITGVHRNQFIQAIRAELPTTTGREPEGPLIAGGYVRPLYLQPIYQKRSVACSMNCPRYQGAVSYERGICPVAEEMHYNKLIVNEFMRPQMRPEDLAAVFSAFHKVYEQRHLLV